MTKQEYYLVKLNEELAETQQLISKALAFGLDDSDPETNEKNFDAIQREILDVTYFCRALELKTSFDHDRTQFNKRDVKAEKWLSYAKEKGRIND